MTLTEWLAAQQSVAAKPIGTVEKNLLLQHIQLHRPDPCLPGWVSPRRCRVRLRQLGPIAVHCLFSSIFLAFEVNATGSARGMIRQLFGFMYSFWGRILFMVWIASLLWAGGDSWWVCVLIGVFTALNALLNGFLISSHPDFGKSGGGAEDAKRAYLDAHPELRLDSMTGDGMASAMSGGGGGTNDDKEMRSDNPFGEELAGGDGGGGGGGNGSGPHWRCRKGDQDGSCAVRLHGPAARRGTAHYEGGG